MSYNVFGTAGALKVSLGRYVEQMGAGIANDNTRSWPVLTVTRTWDDANEITLPDCGLDRPLAHNGECGAPSNVNFGKKTQRQSLLRWVPTASASATTLDFGTEVQHRSRPVVVSGVYRNWLATPSRITLA